MHGTWMDVGVSRKATEGAKGQESGVRNDRTGVPALRATLPCGSKFHGSDPGMAEQLQNCGVPRYRRRPPRLPSLLSISFRGVCGRARFLPGYLVTHDNML